MEGTQSSELTLADILTPMASVYQFDLSEDGVIDLYEIALDGIELSLVRAAVNALAQEVNWMPRPAAIVAKAKRLEAESSTRTAEPEHYRTYKYGCKYCEDTGLRTVWHPSAMQAAIDLARDRINADELRAKAKTCVVRCTCSSGDDRRIRRERKKPDPNQVDEAGLIFREATMIEVDRSQRLKDQIAELAAWGRYWQPPNYVGEFEQFNEPESTADVF